MLKTPFKYSLIALAIAQSLCLSNQTYAQNTDAVLQEVIIKADRSKKVETSKQGFIENSILETPISLNVFTQAQMQDLRIRTVSDAMKFDVSVSDAYNAVGYAEQFSIRGFTLDNASSYRKDGFAIPGDASIPLENKERLEVIKGINGLQAGFTTPGGVLNFITKRPSNTSIRSTTLEVSERGTLYAALDLGGKTADKQFGYRINAAGEKLRSYVKGANGHREFISAAFDWKINPHSLFQIDLDNQEKSQISVPGFQLFNGINLPTNIKADLMLNKQPWTKPVLSNNRNLGLNFEQQLNSNWSFNIAGNWHQMKRDDYTAFPYGCSDDSLYPGYCANGNFDVYDYRSLGEIKKINGMQALVNGQFKIGPTQHQVAFGMSNTKRRDYFADYVYDYAGSSNVFNPVNVPPSSKQQGPVSLRRNDTENSFFIQDIMRITAAWSVHAGLRIMKMDRSQVGSPDFSKNYSLPNLAFVFNSDTNSSFYLSASQGLEHGGIAPIGTINQNLMLKAEKSKQFEVGHKANYTNIGQLTAAIFHIEKPLEYTNSANLFVSAGLAQHRGIELALQNKLHQQLEMGISATVLHAIQKGTNDANIEGKRVTNVPNLKAMIFADYTLSSLPQLHLTGNWQYSGRKAFSPDNRVKVPSYHVLNLGSRYTTKINGVTSTLRFDINNALNKFYWRDVTQSLGGYLFPGAPRTYKLSAQFDF
jgi:iron complex outermembrane receptor protein